jgi:hypothetical protein
MSWAFMAEGAVLLFSAGRLMPSAAQSRSERSCRPSSFSANSRAEALTASVCMNGSPRFKSGGFSLMGCGSAAGIQADDRPRINTAVTSHLRKSIVAIVFFILTSVS